MAQQLRNAKRFLCAIAASTLVQAAVGQPAPSGAAQNWPSHNGDAYESAYSQLRHINRANITKLGLAWSLDLDDERMLEATPLAVDGVLYFSGSYSKVYAVDASAGKLLWSYDPEEWRRDPAKFRLALPVNRGVAFDAGRIFIATLDGRLIALNSKTGMLLWSVDSVPLHSVQTITGAPRVFRGKVLIGNGGGDFGARGFLAAYDAATGRELWRFNVVPGAAEENRADPAMERAAATWTGAKRAAGGSPWDSISVDPTLNRVYIGTGNPSPNDPDERGSAGDNLYTASIVALDANNGKYLWHYQVNPRDAWDFDAAEQMTLADLVIDGKPRKVLMQSPKNGFFYVLDRINGKLISTGKIGKATWADRIDLASGRPVDTENNRYQSGAAIIWPTALGAHAWQTMAFSPQTGLVYIPYMQLGVRYSKGSGEALYGGLATSVVEVDSMDGKGALVAWDPVAEKSRWTIPHRFLYNGGALATAGALVLQGAADGYLSAYDAFTGARLWQFNAGLGIIAAPISYAVADRQFIAVLVGYGATNIMGVMNAGWKYGDQPRRLLSFTLDGKATLPPTAPQRFSVQALDDPAIKLDDVDVHRGESLFNAKCAACHGLNAVSAGPPGPDLRESQVALRREALYSVVHDGAIAQRGMPPFAELDATQVAQMYAYIRARARDTQSNQPAAPPPRP